MDDWQSWAALGVVVVTAAAMLWRTIRNQKAGGSGCGGSCGCGSKIKVKPH